MSEKPAKFQSVSDHPPPVGKLLLCRSAEWHDAQCVWDGRSWEYVSAPVWAAPTATALNPMAPPTSWRLVE